jgi:hypothetical protein
MWIKNASPMSPSPTATGFRPETIPHHEVTRRVTADSALSNLDAVSRRSFT